MGDVRESISDQAIIRSTLHTTRLTATSGELSMEHEVELYKDVTLTAAQLDTLNATPISLITAPGAGKFLLVSRVVGFMDFVTTAYAGASQILSIKYTNASGTLIAAFSEVAFGEAAADIIELPAIPLVVPVLNAAVIASTNADWTTGDGIVYLRLYYRIVTGALNGTP